MVEEGTQEGRRRGHGRISGCAWPTVLPSTDFPERPIPDTQILIEGDQFPSGSCFRSHGRNWFTIIMSMFAGLSDTFTIHLLKCLQTALPDRPVSICPTSPDGSAM